MPSIHPSYEYDIFISYRQNDNKRDKWVTQFVDALRDELDATLKKPVSIYFDENPHDGLLETHQVGATLEKKLKCLVFIPIISQTYCDTESFAWSQELLPFLKMANEDELGINITLANGNVASRILPIKIHDLDLEDRELLESELKGSLRSIDFRYKAAGVNRPLTAKDDQVRKPGQVLYSDQINKVANALKEIGTAILKKGTKSESSVVNEVPEISSKSHKSPTSLIALASIVLIALISILTYMFWNGTSHEIRNKSIAVLPFTKVNTGDQIDALAFGIHDDLLTKLSKLKELRVTSRTSVMEYENTRTKISEIAHELGVGYILEGSIQQSNNRFRLNIQLIDGETDDHLWAEIFDLELTTDNIFQIQSKIAANIASEMKMNFAASKANNETEPPTKSITALKLYNQGALLMQSKPLESINRIKNALNIDPEFHKARTMLIRVSSLYFKGNPDSVSFKKLANDELSILIQECEDAHLKLMAKVYYDYYALGDFKLAKQSLLNGDQDNMEVIEAQSYIARRLDDWATYFEFAENNLKKDPRNPSVLQDLSYSLIADNKIDQGIAYIERSIEYSDQPIYKDGKFNILVSIICEQEEAERFFEKEKSNLNLRQIAVWKYWLDYYNRDFSALIDPAYEVPKGMVISNGDYSNLILLPSELFIAQAYWLKGDKAKAKEQVALHAQYLLDYHDSDHCPIEQGNDFYGNEATKHIARGYALALTGQPEQAVKEAEHAMKLYPFTKDGVQGRVVQDLAFRLIAFSSNAEKTMKMADKLLGSISWISVETIKNDPIYDQYRELDAYKKIIATYD